jgi:hypothetical protein
LTLASNEIALKGWADLIPLLKQYELAGTAQLNASLQGSSDKPDYQAKISINELTAKAPYLKSQPRIDGSIEIITDQIRNMIFTVRAPGNDLKIQGKLVSFSQPHLELQANSTAMDLDQLIDFPPPRSNVEKTESEKEKPSSPPSTGAGKLSSDYDALLEPLRKNKMMIDMVAKIGVEIKNLKAYNVKMTDIDCRAQFKNLSLDFIPCDLTVFSGRIKTDGHFQFRPSSPTYQFGTHVTGLDLKQAVESQLQLFKNTLIGKASFEMRGQGASFNPDPAISNLNANGKLNVNEAVFATIDVMKMVSEALNKSLTQVGEKVPGLKGKTVNLPSQTSHYESISSDFGISQARFSAPNFSAKAKPNQGIDLKGKTLVGLKDYSLDSDWEVIDTYNLTRLKDVSIEQGGVRVEHVLAENNGPIRFPIHVGCSAKAPCYSYSEVPSFLAKVAMNNASKALTGRAKEEVRKKAEAVIERAVPQEAQDSIKQKLKGFFQ